MSTLVTALFKAREGADRAVNELLQAGFPLGTMSLLMSEPARGGGLELSTATKAPEGAAAGAAVGGVLGAVIGSLLAMGSLAVPGLGLIAAGPLVAALAGLGAGGAAGGVAGALIGLGIPEHEATFYSERVAEGGVLVGVYSSDDRLGLARDVLAGAGGESVKTD